MAHLSIVAARVRHDTEPHSANVPFERRDAGPHWGARGGVLREGVWHHVSRATAQRPRPESPRSVIHHANRPGNSHGRLRVPRFVPDAVLETIRPDHATTHRATIERATQRVQRVGAFGRGGTGRNGFDTRHYVDGPVPGARTSRPLVFLCA